MNPLTQLKDELFPSDSNETTSQQVAARLLAILPWLADALFLAYGAVHAFQMAAYRYPNGGMLRFVSGAVLFGVELIIAFVLIGLVKNRLKSAGQIITAISIIAFGVFLSISSSYAVQQYETGSPAPFAIWFATYGVLVAFAAVPIMPAVLTISDIGFIMASRRMMQQATINMQLFRISLQAQRTAAEQEEGRQLLALKTDRMILEGMLRAANTPTAKRVAAETAMKKVIEQWRSQGMDVADLDLSVLGLESESVTLPKPAPKASPISIANLTELLTRKPAVNGTGG